MKTASKSSICALLILCAANCLAVQDPQISIAELDTKLSTIAHEIAQIDKTLVRTSPRSAEHNALNKRRAALQTERKSLIQSKEMGKSVRDNPLVRYGDEDRTVNKSAQIDKLFEK